MNPTKSKKQSLHASWKLMNPRGGVWNPLHKKIMKITSRRKTTIRKVIALGKLPAWQVDKVESKTDVIFEAQRRAKESPLCFFWWASVISKKCGVRTKSTVVLQGDIVKDDSGACAVFTEQCSSAWLLVYARQPTDAETAYAQARLEDAPKLLKIPQSECPITEMYGYVFHDRNGQNHGQELKIQWYLWNEHFLVIRYRRDSSKKLY